MQNRENKVSNAAPALQYFKLFVRPIFGIELGKLALGPVAVFEKVGRISHVKLVPVLLSLTFQFSGFKFRNKSIVGYNITICLLSANQLKSVVLM